ncbi:MAG TPA: hypothetical protein VFQ84_00425 [Arenimonas sp.]|uniref:hypothetical protein n=1 Tax=Arenimonas sp. TaxID=1872635 RepID=UPI002D7F9757|nr:hypothetical protein [Arenimonas sp.]HEU0151786.1 hypothetical protein [Arenimonas sp.]
MRHSKLAVILFASLALAACGGDDAAAPSDARIEAATEAASEAAEAPAPLPPLPTGDFRITAVSLGKAVDEEGQVVEPLTVFAPGDRLHAAVVAVGSSEGLTLSARWLAADGTEVAKAGQSLSPDTPTVTTFSIAQPEPWPPGAYQVEIAINDRVVETRTFEVR